MFVSRRRNLKVFLVIMLFFMLFMLDVVVFYGKLSAWLVVVFHIVFGWIVFLYKNALNLFELWRVLSYMLVGSIITSALVHIYFKIIKEKPTWDYKKSIRLSFLVFILQLGVGCVLEVSKQTYFIVKSENELFEKNWFGIRSYKSTLKIKLHGIYYAQKDYYGEHGRFESDIQQLVDNHYGEGNYNDKVRFATIDQISNFDNKFMVSKIKLDEIREICPDCEIKPESFKILAIAVNKKDLSYEVMTIDDQKTLNHIIKNGFINE